jgi:hypothetical protein
MSVQEDMMRAEAIREVRAAGVTMPGVAELIVDFHGATHVLANTQRIQALGEEVAASDSEQGAKMREILQGEAKKAEAKQLEDQTSKPVETESSAASATAPAAVSTDAAAASSAPPAAAGDSAAPAASAPAENENPAPSREGQAQGS